MPSTGYATYSTKLYYSADGSSYTQLAQTTDITPLDESVGSIDISNCDSAAVNSVPVMEKIAGWIDPGICAVGYIYNESNYNIMAGFKGVAKYWRVVFNGSSKVEFQGFVSKNNIDSPQGDEKITCSAEITLMGAAVFTVV